MITKLFHQICLQLYDTRRRVLLLSIHMYEVKSMLAAGLPANTSDHFRLLNVYDKKSSDKIAIEEKSVDNGAMEFRV